MLFNLQTYGKPAVRRLADLGVLTPATVLEHFVWVTDEELAIFADSGAVASNNPGSNLRLSTGICRVRDIMDAGGRVAFGTDGISFSDRDDFFAELRLAAYLQRLPRDFGQGRLDSEQLLRAAAGNGARALGLPGQLGSLEPGKYADLLIVRQGSDLLPARPLRRRAVPGRGARPRRVSGHRHRHGARPGPDGQAAGSPIVDEALVRDRFAEAMAQRVYRPSAEVRRWAELGALVEPYLPDFYRPWYETPDRARLRLQPAAPARLARPPRRCSRRSRRCPPGARAADGRLRG